MTELIKQYLDLEEYIIPIMRISGGVESYETVAKAQVSLLYDMTDSELQHLIDSTDSPDVRWNCESILKLKKGLK